jgi:hypothetical protein
MATSWWRVEAKEPRKGMPRYNATNCMRDCDTKWRA